MEGSSHAQFPVKQPFHGGAEFLNKGHTCQTGAYAPNQKCSGLTPAGHITASECQHKCCEDATCSTWQWHEESGCLIGDAVKCSPAAETLLQGGSANTGWHGQTIHRSRGAIHP